MFEFHIGNASFRVLSCRQKRKRFRASDAFDGNSHHYPVSGNIHEHYGFCEMNKSLHLRRAGKNAHDRFFAVFEIVES